MTWMVAIYLQNELSKNGKEIEIMLSLFVNLLDICSIELSFVY